MAGALSPVNHIGLYQGYKETTPQTAIAIDVGKRAYFWLIVSNLGRNSFLSKTCNIKNPAGRGMPCFPNFEGGCVGVPHPASRHLKESGSGLWIPTKGFIIYDLDATVPFG